MIMKRILPWILPLGLLLLGAWLLFQPTRPTPETQPAREAVADAVGMSGAERAQYVLGEDPDLESAVLLAQEDYWVTRYTYPTFQFDQRWLLAAAEKDTAVSADLPAGTRTNSYNRLNAPNLPTDRFTSLGPSPLQSDGCDFCFPYGIVAGRTNVVLSHPVTPTIAFAGSDGGGVWKTEDCCDENTTWRPVTDDPLIASIAIGDMTIDPNDPTVLYAGTGDLRYGSWSFGSVGVLKSSDLGETWTVKGADVFGPVYQQPAGEFPQYQAIGKVAVDPRNSDKVVVTTKQGLYFSFDAAESWTGPCFSNDFTTQRQDGTGLILHDNGTSTDLFVAIGTRGIATAVQTDLDQNGANGIYKTTMPDTAVCPDTSDWELLTRGDNGWPAVTGAGTPQNLVGRIDLAISPSNPAVMYAQVHHVQTRGLQAVYRTDDGGATWTQGAVGADLQNCTGGSGDYRQNWYDQGIIIDPNNPDVTFMNTVDLWRSTDGGATYTNLTCGYSGGNNVHVDQHGLAYVDGQSNQLLVGNDGGVYYTDVATKTFLTDEDFQQLNNTLNTIEFYSGDITVNFAYSDQPGAAGGAQDNGSMVKIWDVGNGEAIGPAQWQGTTGGDGIYSQIEPKQGQVWFHEAQFGYMMRSTTGPVGAYSLLSNPWYNNGVDRVSFLMPYQLDKHNCPGATCTNMIVGTQRVWESVNLGNSFYVNSPDLTKGVLGSRSFLTDLAYSFTDGSVAMVATLDGNVQVGFGLGQGVANSATWVDVTAGNAVLPNRPVLDVVTHPLTPTIGFTAVGGFDQNTPTTPGHVFMLTCNADCSQFSWQNKSGNLPNIPANSIMVNPNRPGQVFVGTDWGLYYTDDITAVEPVWQLFTAGLPRVMIWDMTVDRGFTTLALFTRSRGAYVWPLPVPEQDVLLTSDRAQATAEAGTSVTYVLTATNTGDTADQYDISVAGMWPATSSLTETAVLGAGEATGFTVTVTVPLTATHEQLETTTVTAVSQSDMQVQATLDLQTTAFVSQAGVALQGETEATAVVGSTIMYSITLTNTGNVTDTFDLLLAGPWSAASSVPTATLGAGEGVALTVEVTVPLGATDGETGQTTLTAVSRLDSAVQATHVMISTAVWHKLYLPAVVK